jgi:2-C-methyl-D-erythritol 4-phosphate cytidylyltransferase
VKTTAIVLAAGSGSRMKSSIKKQYLMLLGRPVVSYSLAAFEVCSRVDEIILVCGAGEEEQCRRDIVEPGAFKKVKAIVPGGKERYHSVYEGLKAAGNACTTVLIHDGARPIIDGEMIERLLDETAISGACVAGMPVKDTIKKVGADGCVVDTPPREQLWMVQTPQVFSYPLIMDAYRKVMREDHLQIPITDDAMVLEYAGTHKVRLIEGSYENLKITTPEDLVLAEAILKKLKFPEKS